MSKKEPEFKAVEGELVLRCGNCAWMHHVAPPEDKPEYKDVDRGYCYFNPPAVYPIPRQTKSLALQQQAVEMIPQSFRPPVDGNDSMCGRYYPDEETLKIINEKQGKKDHCDGSCPDCKGDCNGEELC